MASVYDKIYIYIIIQKVYESIIVINANYSNIFTLIGKHTFHVMMLIIFLNLN